MKLSPKGLAVVALVAIVAGAVIAIFQPAAFSALLDALPAVLGGVESPAQ